MGKAKKRVAGIDISKDAFNVHFGGMDFKYANNQKGFQSFLKDVPGADVYAMEATGNYHYRLAVFLKMKGKSVLVLNPGNVSWWIKSLGNKAKTDKRDARLIAQYAGTSEAKNIPGWELLAPKLVEARVVVSLLGNLSRLRVSSDNVNHAASLVLGKSNSLLGVMPNVSDVCRNEQEKLEQRLCNLVKDVFPKQFNLLQTIPGIGSKTAACILASVRDIESFETCGQLSSFIGLVPRVEQSGTSVNKKCGIAKAGNIYLRGLLFMCSFSAVQFCKPCRELYDRLLRKGKPKKLALVAVMHRLVKIAYGVVKSGEPYRGGCLAVSS